MRVRASDTLWPSPPESLSTLRSSYPSSPTRSRRRENLSSGTGSPRSAGPKRMLSATVPGNRYGDCSTMPTRRLSSLGGISR
jgi:hypothetical protein